jgi:hypothetical protein
MKSFYAAIAICFLLTACGSAKTANTGSAQAHEHKPVMDVAWELSGTQLTVKVTTDLHISPEHYGLERQPNEGHIHMYLDNGEKIGVKQETQVFKNLAPGPHNLKVSLHNNDHTPYDVTKTFDFEVK